MKNIILLFILIVINSAYAIYEWNVIPIINVDAFKNPIKCGYLYKLLDEEIILKFEKYVVNDHVITAFSVANPKLKINDKVSVKTETIDTNKKFKNKSFTVNEYKATANLEEEDAGGKLFYELAIFGGVLKINDSIYKLPAKLPREISALYLNCAGDLIRPDNEIPR